MPQKDNVASANALAVRALPVSSDGHTVKALSQIMEQSTIHVAVTPTLESAIRELCRNKYEAILVDCQNPQDRVGFLRKQRATTSNRTAVVWGIVNSVNESSELLRAGANFVVVRPLSQTVLGRTLKVSYPLMLREKRRYHRIGMQTQVFVSSSSHPEFVASSINISEGGMALDGAVPLQMRENLNLRFKLSGGKAPIKIAAEVCWYDHDGRVGIQFVRLPQHTKEQIQGWIAERFEESFAKAGAD